MKKLSESIWRNISQRSEGIHRRKEDNIDILDMDDFFNYLKNIYVTNIKTYEVKKSDTHKFIEVPLMEDLLDYMCMYLHYNKRTQSIEWITLTGAITKRYIELLEMSDLFIEYGGTKYNFDEDTDTLSPSHGDHFKNSECVEIIDRFLETIPEITYGSCEGPLVIKRK